MQLTNDLIIFIIVIVIICFAGFIIATAVSKFKSYNAINIEEENEIELIKLNSEN